MLLKQRHNMIIIMLNGLQVEQKRLMAMIGDCGGCKYRPFHTMRRFFGQNSPRAEHHFPSGRKMLGEGF